MIIPKKLEAGDKIGVISSNNRTEWHIMDVGVLQLGAQNIPIYPTISETDYEYILNHSEAIYCFVSDEEVLRKVKLIQQNVPNLKEIFSFKNKKPSKAVKQGMAAKQSKVTAALVFVME